MFKRKRTPPPTDDAGFELINMWEKLHLQMVAAQSRDDPASSEAAAAAVAVVANRLRDEWRARARA